MLLASLVSTIISTLVLWLFIPSLVFGYPCGTLRLVFALYVEHSPQHRTDPEY